jgi:hypothetical protein
MPSKELRFVIDDLLWRNTHDAISYDKRCYGDRDVLWQRHSCPGVPDADCATVAGHAAATFAGAI